MTTSPTPPFTEADELAYQRSLIDPRVLASNSKYVPKLTFDERCAVLGFSKLGVERRQLAAAFGINRSTVNFIIKPSSPHYRNVRRELLDLGQAAFVRKYVTAEMRTRLASFADDEEVKMNDEKVRALHLKEMPVAKAQADSAEGSFSFRETFGDPDKVHTAWVVFEKPKSYEKSDPNQEERPEGWYVRMQDLDDLMGMAKDNKTSASAKKAFLAAVGGEEV